ncbi:MAG: restriction endonuclease subunit S, partial [Zoogloea sp.]|nr:restriction endonuclease subunit S [Zoogloea sp.]
VQQDPDDEPASELLKRIALSRAALNEASPRKRGKQVRAAEDNDWPFSIPDGWEWTSLSNLTRVLNGRAYSKEELLDAGTPVLRVGNLFTSNHWYYSDLELEPEKYCNKGDLIYSWSASFGPFIWNGPKVIYHYHIWKLSLFDETSYSKDFLYKFLLEKTAEIKAAGHGVSMVHMTKEKMEKLPVPVPPLAEQHRIVAKIDELMALCDQLEAEQGDATSAHARLVETLLGTLTQSTDAADLAANWQRLAEHFDTLFTTEASIDALKQTVLQLAVMGRLVNYGTKKQWQTLRLDTVCSEIVDCPHSTPKWTSTGKICVRTSQFTPGKLDLSSSRFVSEATFAERIARLRPESNDILYSREGGILGVACRVPPGVELCLGQRMMLLRPGRDVASTFLELVLNSPVITALARANTTGGAAPRVNVATVKAYPIPVPTLAEQHRIVAKVDELMALCDRLKADLATARQHQALLADTLIDAALEVA